MVKLWAKGLGEGARTRLEKPPGWSVPGEQGQGPDLQVVVSVELVGCLIKVRYYWPCDWHDVTIIQSEVTCSSQIRS